MLATPEPQKRTHNTLSLDRQFALKDFLLTVTEEPAEAPGRRMYKSGWSHIRVGQEWDATAQNVAHVFKAAFGNIYSRQQPKPDHAALVAQLIELRGLLTGVAQRVRRIENELGLK